MVLRMVETIFPILSRGLSMCVSIFLNLSDRTDQHAGQLPSPNKLCLRTVYAA